jgi:WhiB family transcriptional regulator, redox-sensing transcriptional regulator
VEVPCGAADPRVFFSVRPADIATAKSLCTQCSVQEPCLAAALAREEPWGVWGGRLFVAGTVVEFKRGRGRPRKDGDALPQWAKQQAVEPGNDSS